MSPDRNIERSRKNYDFFASVNNEVAFYSKKGLVLVQGDFNSRTGEEKDYVEHDKLDSELGTESLDNQILRNSEDKTINQ